MMSLAKKPLLKHGEKIASIALKRGVAASASACRAVYYQPQVPKAMDKFKK